MKIIEEQLLLNNVNKIKKFVETKKTIKSIYDKIEKLNNNSLQDLSVKSDLEFFDEISFILSVITSIVSNPRIITKGEDVVLRAEQAPSIQSDGYQQTLQDSRLWKRKNIEMVPEYVHYYQSTDEIATYENRFIVLVINIIEQELNKYKYFYVSLIQTFIGQERLSIDQDKQDEALNKISLLLKRIKFIKNTYFYKEVRKKLGIFKTVQPTNILLKNRLYNYCFKFYRKRIAYIDKTSLENDFKAFYFIELLKVLKKNNYAYVDVNKKEMEFNDEVGLNIPTISFTSIDYSIEIKNHPLGFEVTVINDCIKGNKINKAKHLLLFDIENGFNNINNNFVKYLPKENEYCTVEALSLWNIAYIENIDNERGSFDLNIKNDNVCTENELIEKWFNTKVAYSYASKELYEKYCPVCKETEKEIENNIYKCTNCNSIYTFYKDKNNKQCVWFIRLRRV